MHSDGGINKSIDSDENKDLTFVDIEGVDDDEQTIVDIVFGAEQEQLEQEQLEQEQANYFGYLIIRDGEHRGRVFQVKNGTIIGRNEGVKKIV